MSVPPTHSRFSVLFESALHNYERQTGIKLAEHPGAEQLLKCDSVESVVALLQEQARAFSEFRGGDGRVMKSLKSAVSVLHTLSGSAFGETVGLVPFPPAKAIFTAFAILLAAVKDVSASYDALVDLLESFECFLGRLDIYTKIALTGAMTEIIIKIMVELLSTLALVTRQIKQKRTMKFVKKLLGENEVEAVLQRLDRLTTDEARTTAAQTLEVVYGLVQNMRVVMDDGKAAVEGVRDALEIMQQMVNEINKSKRDTLQRDIRIWLSPPDPWKNHNIARESRHTGTAAWFAKGRMFSEWKSSESGSLLWVHGKPGAGKSVLCSTIIQNIDDMRKSGLASLAFFYCDFREDEKKDRRGLLSSLLVQLCHQSDSYSDILSKFYSEHAGGSQHPSDDALVQCLKDLLHLPGQAPVYLVVDAVDECPNTTAVPSPREKVLMLIEELIDSQAPNLRICVTSRPETDIKAVLDSLAFHSVSLHDEIGQMQDIDDYIKSTVNTDPRMRRWKPADKQMVIDALTINADGMFRWVYCQIVYLRGCLPGRIRRALMELPDTLDETYERTLRDIDQTNWEFAHRLFQCVTVASRPLTVEELAEFLAFDFEAGPIPKFYEDWRLEDPLDAVLSTCSSLLTVVKVDDSPVIQFSHFSVKEFLTSARLAKSSDINSRRYHASMTQAHSLVGQACLGILLHLDEDVTNESLQQFPLAEYAAKHWVDHARFHGVSQNVEDGMKELFDPRKPHLMVWIWLFDPGDRLRSPDNRGIKPSQPDRSPLHYAAICGLHGIVKFLVVDRSQDVHSSDSQKRTPLHHASSCGHVEVSRVLLEHDADVTAQDIDGWTPLHCASYEGHLEVVRVLIEYGADVTAQNEHWSTPLHMATAEGGVELARILLEHGADITAQDKNGWSSLHILASSEGREEVLRFLLERGADVTAQEENGYTPLHMVSISGSAEAARVLLEHGTDATSELKPGETALNRALGGERWDVARVLLEYGAKAVTQDRHGWTPLHHASSGGPTEIVHILLERGADATAKTSRGFTPLHRVSRAEQPSVEVVLALLNHGADPTAKDGDESTPLHEASLYGHVEIVRILLERGVDVTSRDKYGATPLHQARNHVEAVRLLLEYGADPTAEDERGLTPLHAAAAWGDVRVVRVLLGQGVDLNSKDNNGRTPLDWAMQVEKAEIARVLLEHGADATAQVRDRLKEA